MKEPEQRDNLRVPIALRIKLRFRKVDTFVSKFATNISSNGMFISSRKPKEKGTLLRFELRLADDSTVISGRGKVAWVRPYDPENPKQPHGMGIEFITLSQGSRELIGQIVSQRIDQGLGEDDGIPFARRATSVPGAEEAPETPAPTPAPTPATPAPGSGGAIPESLSLDTIDSAPIDMGSVVARARALVGGSELDAELEELFKVSAAPVAETVDEASNDLARMLGGQAVSAKRTRHSDPPTGVEYTALPPGPEDEEEQDEEPVEPALEAEPAALEAVPPELEEAEPEPEALAAPELPPELEPVPEAPIELEAAAAEEAPAEAELEAPAELAPIEDLGPGPRYARAETDASPEILEEIDADDFQSQGHPAGPISDRAITQVHGGDEEALEALPVIETAPEAPAAPSAPRAPSEDDSLDIDIDEVTHIPTNPDYSESSSPGGVDVGVLDAAGLEDHGVRELSNPGSGPIDLASLAEIPADEDELEADLDLPDRPQT